MAHGQGYILDNFLSNYHLYHLYVNVYFIKCSVSFLCVSEYSYDFVKCNVPFLCIL